VSVEELLARHRLAADNMEDVRALAAIEVLRPVLEAIYDCLGAPNSASPNNAININDARALLAEVLR